ncbi:MAG: cobalamin-dependent protein, partial [Promethearchaeota archaeon]
MKKVLYVQPFVLDKGGLEDNKIHIAYSKGILIWAVYLDNYLKSKIHDLESMLLYLPFEEGINIDSYTQENAFFSQMDELISELSFDKKGNIMVCISATTSHHFLSSKLIATYFQKRFPENVIVVGGVHASVRPNDFIYLNSPFDYIVIGEGELSLYNLIKENVGKQKTPKIIRNNPVPILDDLPPLDFSLFD